MQSFIDTDIFDTSGIKVDIAVYDPRGKLQLIVDVKNKQMASEEWVVQTYQNLLEYMCIPHIPYFLLALPEFFYLWQNADGFSTHPNFRIDAAKVLSSYIEHSGRFLDNISGMGLEFLVSVWLRDLMSARREDDVSEQGLQWFFESGLYDAIRNGTIAFDTFV